MGAEGRFMLVKISGRQEGEEEEEEEEEKEYEEWWKEMDDEG